MSATDIGPQPFLNEQLVAVAAPTQLWSKGGGDFGDQSIDGIYHADWRLVRSGRLRVGGDPLEVAGETLRDGGTSLWGLARCIDDDTADPRIIVERHRDLSPGVVVERVALVNGLDESVTAPVELNYRIEFTEVQTIKAGAAQPVPVRVSIAGDELLATDGARTVIVSVLGGELDLHGNVVTVRATVDLAPRGRQELAVRFVIEDLEAVVVSGEADIHDLPSTENAALNRWAARAIEDCRGLVLDAGQGAFLAAGAPWFLTLFGRDSLISARFLLPLSLGLARTTLQTLASRQGVVVDPHTAEQPGKILHELRAGALGLPSEGVLLPPVYYGTIDATGLWVILLHDAWRAGMDLTVVAGFRPNLEAALGWLRDFACPDDSGFLKYRDESGHGLANQGWKDSGDSVRFRDGAIAEGPIALAEVQAQACLAAVDGAALLDALGGDGTPWRQWAAGLRERFRAEFWVERGGISYPAIALDGSGVPVDSMTSNIGQLIGTTLLNPEEERALARLLVTPRFASGYGLRTMAEGDGGYWPLSYHCGSVWTHDTAIAIEGMCRAGLFDEARLLAEQLLRAADLFDSRMPELFSGHAATQAARPVAYPAACRPQAWAAAAVVPVARALGEIPPDV